MNDRRRVFRGDRLKQARERYGLTQTELAERVDGGQNQVYRYENGQAEPSSEMLARLSRELNVTTDWLLGLVDEESAHITEADLSDIEVQLLQAFRRGDFRNLMKIAAESTPQTKPE